MAEPPAITSIRNPLVKRIRSLVGDRGQREQERKLVVEGIRMIEEVLAAGVPIDVLLYDTAIGTHPRAAAVLAAARQRGVQFVPASSRVVVACSQVETPQGMVAVVARPVAALANVVGRPDQLTVVADRIQDPGNLGAMIRIADAAGATAVIVTQGSVDPTNPKAVRATMGSLFHLPVVEAAAEEAIATLGAHRVRILVADQEGAVEYTAASYRRPVALVLGNEGEGVDAPWRKVAEAVVRIPLYGRAESLNVVVAAGLLLYEANRRPASGGVQ